MSRHFIIIYTQSLYIECNSIALMHYKNGFHIYNKKKKGLSNEKDNLLLEIVLESKEGLELNNILKILEKKINQKIENYHIEIANEYPDYNEYQNKLNERKKELSIKRRRVIDKLNNLIESNKIEKKGKKYFPSVSVLNDPYKFLPAGYSKFMIYYLGYFPPGNLEKSLIEYVIRYGLFVIYTFNEYSKISYNHEEGYKDSFLSTWLQESIDLKNMYNIFSDLYFNNKIDKVNIDKISSKINSLLKKNYPNHYKILTEIRKKNLKDLEQRKKDKDKVDWKRFENQIDRQLLINKDTKVDPIKMETISNVAHGRIVSANWYKQLANESEDEKK